MKECGDHTKEVDGVFLITFGDYFKYFNHTTFCKFKDDSRIVAVDDEHELAEYSVMTLKIKQSYSTPIVISCH